MSIASLPIVRADTTDQEINWWVRFHVARETGPYIAVTDYLNNPGALIKLLDALPVGWEASRILNMHREYRVGGNGFCGHANTFCRAACLALLERAGIKTIYDNAGQHPRSESCPVLYP